MQTSALSSRPDLQQALSYEVLKKQQNAQKQQGDAAVALVAAAVQVEKETSAESEGQSGRLDVTA